MGTVPVTIELMSDEHTLRLLHATSKGPLELADLCIECGLSGAACYRRLMDLERLGLVSQVPGERTGYVSDLKRIELLFTDGRVTARIERRSGGDETWTMDALSGFEIEDNTGRELRQSYLAGTDLGILEISRPPDSIHSKLRY
jgi:hypothetical protein